MCPIAPWIRKSFVRVGLLRSLLVAFLVMFASVPLFAQGNRGRILGNVTDVTGGNVAGATVTITDVARGIPHVLTTDTDGLYFAPDLLPGTYIVKVEAKGFKVFQRKNVLLEVGKDVRVDVVLQPGSQTETITVTEQLPMVDTTNTTVGGTISNTIINDLPLNGRNYQNLLTLRPGVMVYPGGGPWTQSTNGIRPEDTSYIVDGLTNDEPFMGLSVTNAAAVLGDAATLLPIDAIQEFNTQVNPQAEFGWKPGAITSVGLKSGTNEMHGSAYAFGRSDSFDARNYFDPVGTPKTPVQLEQYGGSLGGRFIPDKLFYFGAYEAQSYTVGNAFGQTIPSLSQVSTAEADLAAQTPAIPVSALSTYLLQFFGPSGPNASGKLTATFPNVNTSRNALGKIDYHINEHHTLSGSYFFGNDGLIGMDFFTEMRPEFRTNVHSRAQALSGHWAWTPSSAWANEVRAGYTRYTLSIIPANVGIKYNINTGVTNPVLGGLPDITVAGFTTMGGFKNFPKIVGPDNTGDFVDQVTHIVGRHAFKMGGEIRIDKVHQGTFRAGRGLIQFSGGQAFANSTPLDDFLAGDPTKVTLLAGDPTRNLKQWLFAGYFQDDWRITRKITLNLGLRYEYQGVPSDASNLLGNWEPSVGFEQVGKNINSIYKPDYKDFSPRFGIAWDVTGKGTTVVRAGGSVIYDVLPMSTFLSQQDTNNTVTLGLGTVPTGVPIFANGVSTPGIGNIVATGITLHPNQLNWNGSSVGGASIYPANVTSLVQCGNPTPCDIFAMDRNFTTPYVANWTLGIQHAFSGKLALDLAYVANHGSNLPGIRDVNQPDPTTGIQPYAAKFPYLGFINFYANIYRSNYNGLQSTLTARNYHNFDFVVGYTYSHALDNMSYNWNQYLPQNSYDPAAEYGSSDFDIKHRFTLSATYSIPGIKSWGQLLEGWQINTILTLQSGQPWQTFDTSNGFSGSGESADRWNIFGPASNFQSAGQNSIPLCVSGAPGGCTYITSPSGNTVALSNQQTAADWAQCLTDAGPAGSPTNTSLMAAIAGATGGCYVSFNGKSFLLPNGIGQFGNLGRNVFRDTGFRNLDLSISKNWKIKERFSAQFRAEMFNVLNHPNFANPWGGTSGYGAGAFADPSIVGTFGCGCATPDAASVNPVLGSGSARAIQFGLKFLW
jgi:hypothetical protein